MIIRIYNSARSFLVSYWRGEMTWDCPHLYTTIDDAVEAVRIMLDTEREAEGAHIMDSNTGEIYVTCYANEDEGEEPNYEDWNSDYWDKLPDNDPSKIITAPLRAAMKTYTASHSSEDDDVEPGYEDDWSSDYWDDGCPIDDEVGFNPYMGCYDYDC